MDNRSIVMRPKIWFANFMVGAFFCGLGFIWGWDIINRCISVILHGYGDSAENLIIDLVLFFMLEAFFIVMILYYSEAIIINENTIVIRYLFFLNRQISVSEIECLEVSRQKNRYRYYDQISFFIGEKKIKLINSPNEMWQHYDELISYAKGKNINIVRV